MHKIELMTVEEILLSSPQIIKTLQRAFDKCGVANGWTPEDVIVYTLQDPKDFHIWKITGNKGEAIAYGSTRSIHYPRGSALSVVTLANLEGDPVEFSLYSDVVNRVEELAIEGNYDKIEITGRKGWQKVLEPFGYELDYCTYSKEI